MGRKKYSVVQIVDTVTEEIYIEVVRSAWLSEKNTKVLWTPTFVPTLEVKDIVKNLQEAGSDWVVASCKLISTSG